MRLFHWGLLVAIVGMVTTASLGWMDWHFRCGYLILALLLFRVLWGFVGGHWARFSSFVRGPGEVLGYLRGERTPLSEVGHNPMGALSVIAMLLVLGLQVASGLAADDEIAASGPLARHLSGAWVSLATLYHTKIGKLLLLALITLHVGAIVRYRRQGTDLVTPMLHGDKHLATPAPSSRDDRVMRVSAAVCFALCLGAVLFGVRALG